MDPKFRAGHSGRAPRAGGTLKGVSVSTSKPATDRHLKTVHLHGAFRPAGLPAAVPAADCDSRVAHLDRRRQVVRTTKQNSPQDFTRALLALEERGDPVSVTGRHHAAGKQPGAHPWPVGDFRARAGGRFAYNVLRGDTRVDSRIPAFRYRGTGSSQLAGRVVPYCVDDRRGHLCP